MYRKGDLYRVTGGWIHFFPEGEIVRIVDIRREYDRDGNLEVFVDCMSTEGELPGLIQAVKPLDLVKL